ncbi:GNAT family N-acetyltransferase [Sinomonas sp. ASV322]|uniref:bifunctional acetate--CoA ligase family protein/GNAT family N-acetyltransferase n=1 Tax=Sinomonas sp. ASV322 TaxID=3041920 RepID=UPI0027DE633E|nr:GNAT family N-acetyltransferase [Sinomonas sp. ASV322]MDQ4500861.1 GNAT family N-acetyltransferase [Sinomonas sp. ASV322]
MADQGSVSAYPQHWEADVVLRDGGTAHLRPIRPSDAEALQAFHLGQSENSVYLRFFSYKARLTDAELKRFTEVDYRDRVALVITIGDEILGVGRYDRLDDPAEAEVAFNISDRHQGRGLGSILLEHLAAAARERGIRRFTAEVLPENRKMLTVFAEAGYAVERHFDDGVVMVAFEIDPTEKSRAVMESREHRAEALSVRGLLAPRSVAIVGASRRWGSIGQQLLAHIVEGGFPGGVAAVNREALELGGMLTYAGIRDVPGPVDVALVAVPYDDVAEVVAECAAAGVRGVVVASAGHAEDGERGLARQRELVRDARARGMRVVGPGSLGIVNTDPDVRLNASLAPDMPRRGTLGLFSQSAAIGIALYAAAARRRLGFSTIVSAGNRADVSGNDVMQFWEDDAATSAVALYLESFGNPRKFSRIARRLARTKPVVVAKSDVLGVRLPPGHAVRASEAPPGALDAMLRQAGVIRVSTLEELVDVAQVLQGPLPAGPRVAVVANAVSLGRVVADTSESRGLVVRLNAWDVDLSGPSTALPEFTARVLEIMDSGEVDAVVVALVPTAGVRPHAVAEALAECAASRSKPVVAAFTGILGHPEDAEGMIPDDSGAELTPARIPAFTSAGDAVAALGAVVRYSEWLAREEGTQFEAEHDAAAADALIARVLAQAGAAGTDLVRLEPDLSAALLACYGISVLPSRPVVSAEEAVAAADELGWPVAVKSTAASLRHRLDLGTVRLDIRDEASLRSAVGVMEESLAAYGPLAEAPGEAAKLEVQRMAPLGEACVVRAIEDPLLGPVVSFGLAGDAVALLDDWAHRVPPLTTQDVGDLVRAPRAAQKLFGYEGLPALDVAALEGLVGRVALLKDTHPEVSVLELRPVVVSETGLTVLHADVWLGNAAHRTDTARRAMSEQ